MNRLQHVARWWSVLFTTLVWTGFSHSALAGVTENFVDLPAGHIYYQDSGGKGEAVVFLHPASGNSLVFEKQIDAITKAGFRFIAFDRPGQGQSTRPAAPAAAEPLLVEQLMDHLGVQRFHVIGIAAGGGSAMQYALTNPKRVLSLVISGSIGYVEDAGYSALINRIRPAEFRLLPVDFRELGPSYRTNDAEGVKRWMELSHRGQTPPLLNAPAREGAPPPAGAPATLGVAPGGAKPVSLAGLGTIAVPTLLMTGDADLYTPPAVLRIFKQNMPRAELVVVPDSGHAAQWENPEFFNTAVLKFLRKH